MQWLQHVTADPFQKQTFILEDGTTFSLELAFKPLQQGWFITELIYGDFTLRGVRVVVSPNMLNQFCNIIPFGIACFSVGNREPSLVEDFLSQAAQLYVLNAEEVAAYTEYLKSG